MFIPRFTTHESLIDSRNVKNEDLISIGVISKGGVNYLPTDIENQRKVGICTGISDTQLNQKKNSKKYSADFFYLLEKRIDGNWIEGSSILTSLKVANKIGFLPVEFWNYTTESDRDLPYEQYITKLQTIPESEVQRLILLCVDKIAGYAQIDISNPQNIANAILNSKAGILCRFNVGVEWYSKNGVITWDSNLIDPLQPPVVVIGGHAIIGNSVDFTTRFILGVANTWSSLWNKLGCGTIDLSIYPPTEAWVILDVAPQVPAFSFKNDLAYSMTSPDVKQLQIILNKNPLTLVSTSGVGSSGNETNYFGGLTLNAVKRFQAINHIPQTGFVGIITRTALNKLL